ncbi:PqqD family protein [Elstera litoralis]|uniref:PqqD family protein n=1 Tax=Elstera litoralis TaxID=552518 RepID=UPI001E2E46BF|nr:PqqD family protein [Elstera litoralis]
MLATEVGGEMVIMNVEKGVYFGLDPIGTDIWKRLEESITVAALAGALVQVYDADIACIERDVLALLTRMVEQGLVEVG